MPTAPIMNRIRSVLLHSLLPAQQQAMFCALFCPHGGGSHDPQWSGFEKVLREGPFRCNDGPGEGTITLRWSR